MKRGSDNVMSGWLAEKSNGLRGVVGEGLRTASPAVIYIYICMCVVCGMWSMQFTQVYPFWAPKRNEMDAAQEQCQDKLHDFG